MAWVLMIVVISGGAFHTSATFSNLQYQSREACERAGKTMLAQTNGVAFMCTSLESGETIRIKP